MLGGHRALADHRGWPVSASRGGTGQPATHRAHLVGCAYTGLFQPLQASAASHGASGRLYRRLQKQFLQLADTLLHHPFAAFATVMGGRAHDFVWGSNAVAANQGMVLLYAWRLTHNPAYRQAAAGNLDYLLGRNATGYCFVTGFGTRSPMHPHHRPSIADDVPEPVPGLLVGGPNPGMQDHCEHYPTHAPDAAYVDESCAYACNEIAINWNAPLVYLVHALRASSR